MKWTVTGADKTDGREVTVTVDAPDERAAEAIAAKRGLFVAAVDAVSTKAPEQCSTSRAGSSQRRWVYGIAAASIVGLAVVVGVILRSTNADKGLAHVAPTVSPVAQPSADQRERRESTTAEGRATTALGLEKGQGDHTGIRLMTLPPRTATPVIGTFVSMTATPLRQLGRFVGHDPECEVRRTVFSRDGTKLLTASRDGTARLWDVRSREQLRSFSTPNPIKSEGGPALILAADLTAEGRYVATGGSDSAVRVWDAQTSQEVQRFVGHEGLVDHVAFSPDGRRLATAGFDDHSARMWDVATGRELWRFTGHTNQVRWVEFSPDGRRLLTGSMDKTMRLLDAETGRELRRFDLDDECWAAQFHPNGKLGVSSGYGYSVQVWDLDTGEEAYRLKAQSWGVAFTPDGSRVLTCGMVREFELWDLATAQEIGSYERLPANVAAFAISPDGQAIICGSQGSVGVALFALEDGHRVGAVKPRYDTAVREGMAGIVSLSLGISNPDAVKLTHNFQLVTSIDDFGVATRAINTAKSHGFDYRTDSGKAIVELVGQTAARTGLNEDAIETVFKILSTLGVKDKGEADEILTEFEAAWERSGTTSYSDFWDGALRGIMKPLGEIGAKRRAQNH